MSWNQIVGHDFVRQRFERIWKSKRVASTWLFVGPDGVGKRTFAMQLARTILCEQNRGEPFDSCDNCPGCRQVINGGHPDLIRVSKPSDKSSIPLELLIGGRERRQEEGLCRAISLKSVRGMGKVAMIDDADYLNNEGANALLKTLEEPPPGTVLILIGTSLNRQLPTIISRCQIARFDPMQQAEVVRILHHLQEFEAIRPLEELAGLSGGNVQLAMLMNDPDVYEFRKSWLSDLAMMDPAADETGKRLVKFAEDAGKETALRRDRMQMVANVAMVFFQTVLHRLCNIESWVDSETDEAARAAAIAHNIEPDQLSRCIDRTVEFQKHIYANVALASAVEPWLDDLSALLAGKLPVSVDW